jgi:tripartite-type tricarboxylate transporter receptor subunit TctC
MHRTSHTAIAIALVLLGVVTLSAQASHAGAWPQRAVRIIVPLGPGSATDIAGRVYAERLSKRWGQPVTVENRPGGDFITGVVGFLGDQDDHTLLLSPASPITINPLTHDRLPYDPANLLPISLTSDVSVGITVPASLKIASLNELVVLARSQPGKLNWAATPGTTYLTFAGFQRSANLSIANVPYRDIVQAQNDLTEGRIQVMMCAVAIVLPQVQAGRIKLIAVTSRERIPAAAEVPTVIEAGYPELALDGPVGFYGRRDMLPEVREQISKDVRAVAADPEIARRLLGTAQLVRGSTPEDFAVIIENQRARMAELARASLTKSRD